MAGPAWFTVSPSRRGGGRLPSHTRLWSMPVMTGELVRTRENKDMTRSLVSKCSDASMATGGPT